MDRAKNGPGLFAIVFGAVLSLLLGAALAAAHLMTKPVAVVKEMPADAEPGEVYYVEGTNISGKARQWTRKRQMLAEGGAVDVVFNQDELNAWLASMAPNAAPRPGPGGEAGPEVFSLGAPNFRLHEGRLQCGLPAKFSLWGFEVPTAIQARGRFTQSENGPVYVAEEFFVGSFPVHKIPGYSGLELQEAVLARPDIPEDVKKALAGLSLVAVEGDGLRVVRP